MFLVVSTNEQDVKDGDGNTVKLWVTKVGNQITASTEGKPSDDELYRMARWYEDMTKPKRKGDDKK